MKTYILTIYLLGGKEFALPMPAESVEVAEEKARELLMGPFVRHSEGEFVLDFAIENLVAWTIHLDQRTEWGVS